MRHRRLPFTTGLLALTTLAACADPGFRAEHGCPPGEVCSPVTPDGLFFEGNTFGDEFLFVDAGLKQVARGGREHVVVYEGVDGFFGNTAGSPFVRRFAAGFDDPALDIDIASPPDVIVSGVAAGTAWLRISDPTTDELFDEIAMGVQEVDQVQLLPRAGEWVDADPEVSPWVMHVGTDRGLVAALRSSNGARLVDDGLELTPGDGSSVLRAQPSWDVITLDRSEPGGAVVTARLTDGTTLGGGLLFVDAIDAIRLNEYDAETAAQPLDAGVTHTLCFGAFAGEAAVFGAPWQFAGDGIAAEASEVFPNCVDLGASAPGQATVTARVDGVELAVALELVEPPASARRAGHRQPEPAIGAAQAGARAAAAATAITP